MYTELLLEELDIKEGLRYLGYGSNEPDEKIKTLIEECEREVLNTARPRFIYKIFDIEQKQHGIEVSGTSLVLRGDSIGEHLAGCQKAALMGVTLSTDMDRLLRLTQINNMAKAVIIDSLASVAVEQACDRAEAVIKKDNPDYNQTWRFGVGYGDFPLDIQSEFLHVINAPKTIGLSANTSSMLIPTKSVTAVIGLTRDTIASHKRGCQTCNMRDRCKFRREGGHCNV